MLYFFHLHLIAYRPDNNTLYGTLLGLVSFVTTLVSRRQYIILRLYTLFMLTILDFFSLISTSCPIYCNFDRYRACISWPLIIALP